MNPFGNSWLYFEVIHSNLPLTWSSDLFETRIATGRLNELILARFNASGFSWKVFFLAFQTKLSSFRLPSATQQRLCSSSVSKRENPVNTTQEMASESSTKQDEEVTTKEVPGSIVIYTEEEINTFNHDVKLSLLSLGHFMSFRFATKEVKGVNYFPSRANDLEIWKKMLRINGLWIQWNTTIVL